MNITSQLVPHEGVRHDEHRGKRSFREIASIYVGKRKRASALLLALLIAFFIADLALIRPRTATVTMSLNYARASDGLTPNSTRFNMYEIKTEPVLQRVLHYAGLEGEVTTDTLAECISVEATHDGGVSNAENFISTAYRIGFENNGRIPSRSAETMLSLLCKAYREYFYENYAVSRTSVGQNLNALDISSEYLSRVDIFHLKLNQIARYAAERAIQSENFKDETSGLSFADIQLRAQNLLTYDQVNLRSYVISNAVSANTDILHNQLIYRKRMEQIKYDKQMAAYDVNNEAIALYDKAMTTIYMIPTTNDLAEYYMSVTKTGIDNMVTAADEELIEAISLFKQLERDQTVADAIVSKPLDAGQIEKTEELIKNLDEKITQLFYDLAITDKAYESSHVQRYLMFSDSKSMQSLRSAAAVAVLLTALSVAIDFGVVSLRMRKKESEGQSL